MRKSISILVAAAGWWQNPRRVTRERYGTIAGAGVITLRKQLAVLFKLVLAVHAQKVIETIIVTCIYIYIIFFSSKTE